MLPLHICSQLHGCISIYLSRKLIFPISHSTHPFPDLSPSFTLHTWLFPSYLQVAYSFSHNSFTVCVKSRVIYQHMGNYYLLLLGDRHTGQQCKIGLTAETNHQAGDSSSLHVIYCLSLPFLLLTWSLHWISWPAWLEI